MKGYDTKKYDGIPLGLSIQGSIGKTDTYRIRKGDGNYGTVKGELIQDRYTYFVPVSINNPESDPYRAQWAAAVAKWKYDLLDSEKLEYNRKAKRKNKMSGYNWFIRDAMRGLIDMYVDRGDPASWDFDKNDFTKDGTWRNIDISSFVPISAKAIIIEVETETPVVNKEAVFRKYGNSEEINHCGLETLSANKLRHSSLIIAVDNSQRLDYNMESATWTTLNVSIRGWWT